MVSRARIRRSHPPIIAHTRPDPRQLRDHAIRPAKESTSAGGVRLKSDTERWPTALYACVSRNRRRWPANVSRWARMSWIRCPLPRRGPLRPSADVARGVPRRPSRRRRRPRRPPRRRPRAARRAYGFAPRRRSSRPVGRRSHPSGISMAHHEQRIHGCHESIFALATHRLCRRSTCLGVDSIGDLPAAWHETDPQCQAGDRPHTRCLNAAVFSSLSP